MASALRFIAGRLSKPLRVGQIAKAIATSPRSLQRRFETVLGCAVTVEIRRLRIALAKRLLGEGTLPMSHVARASGFTSPVTMNHVFQREIGMSPTAYRKQVLGERPAG